MKIPFLGGAYGGRSTAVSPQDCYNLFYDPPPKGESNQGALVSTPGATVLASTENYPVRGGIFFDNDAYFVVGNALYRIVQSGTSYKVGEINTYSGRVSMVKGTAKVLITDGTDGWVLTPPNTLVQVTDPDFEPCDILAYQDTYFLQVPTTIPVGGIGGYNQIRHSNLGNPEAWLNTDTVAATGDSDKVVSLISDRRELWVLGERTTEIFYNTGNIDTVFQRFQGGFAQMGCAAKYSPARFDNSVIWLAQNDRGNKMVVRGGEGYQPQIISPPEINYQLDKYSTINDAWSYTYQMEGHEFYVLNFPTEKAVWVLDAVTREWHQRAHTIDGVWPNRERYNCYVFAETWGKHLLGDFENGKIYQLDPNVYTVDGERVPRQRTAPLITEDEKKLRLTSFQLDMEEGTGELTDTDADVFLSYSKDGGHTYGNDIRLSIGNKDYYKRLIHRKLGVGRLWNFRVKAYTPRKLIFKGAYAYTPGESQQVAQGN